MSQAITAVYKNGHFIPVIPVNGFRDNQPVELRIKLSRKNEHPLMRFVGIINDEEAAELSNIIEEEFEKVDLDEW
jgi:predicted DNA-binding antitoxin AbrB/MazE fold protein